MAPTPLVLRVHTNALIAALTGAGLSVGDGVRNDQADGKGSTLPPPCVVVYSMPSNLRLPTLDDWTAHQHLAYQLTCVGVTRQQAEWTADQAEAAITPGFAVSGRSLDAIWPQRGRLMRDDDTGDSLWTCPLDIAFTSSPA